MIPREPTAEMIAAAKTAVSGYPRDVALIAVWQAMWDAAIAAAAREGGDAQQAPGNAPQSGAESASPNLSGGIA